MCENCTPKWLRAKDIQELYGISRSTVYRLMDKGILPYSKPEGTENVRLVSAEDVEALIKQGYGK